MVKKIENNKKSGDATGNVISFEAMKKWLAIPEKIRQDLVRNVYCAKCKDTTTIHSYTIEMDKFGIVLEGLCVKCNKPVARVVENE